MKEVTRFISKSCCGSASVAFRLSQPLSKDFLSFFMEEGYTIPSNYSKAGIFYIENSGIIAQAPFGANIIQIKCRVSKEKCQKHLDNLENLLSQIGENNEPKKGESQ